MGKKGTRAAALADHGKIIEKIKEGGKAPGLSLLSSRHPGVEVNDHG